VVTDEELPSAATLGGLQLNVSGIIGPALGGILLYFFGANWVFAVNALCFVVVIFALLQWKGAKAQPEFPLENFIESFANTIRYVRYAPAIQVVLARNIGINGILGKAFMGVQVDLSIAARRIKTS
jgi:MFS family permease